MAEEAGRRRGIVRLLPLLALIAIGAAVTFAAGGPEQMFDAFARQRAALDETVGRLGFIAALLYILIYAALMTLVWVPAWLCTVIGGFLFGGWAGAVYALIGATSGSVLVFMLGRYGFGGKNMAGWVQRFEAGFRANAFSYILFLRLVPVVPFSVVNLLPALLRVPLRTYALASLIGLVPSTIIYASLGNGLRNLTGAEVALDTAVLRRPDIALPLAGLALLALVPVFYRLWRKGRAV